MKPIETDIEIRFIDNEDYICTYHKIILENAKRLLKLKILDDREDIEVLLTEMLI
jgi:hypothetical protein